MRRSIALIVIATLGVSAGSVASASPRTTEHTGIHAHDLEEATPSVSAQASAEPDRSATLTRANPRFTWESTGSGASDPFCLVGAAALFRCTGAPFKCTYILLHVDKAG